MLGIRSFDRRVISRNPLPPGTKILVLDRQIGAGRFNEENARQVILGRNVGEAAIFDLADLADCATFDSSLVCNDHAFTARDETDSANDAGTDVLSIDVDTRQRSDFKKVRSLVQQQIDSLPRKQPSPVLVPPDVVFSASKC